MAIGRIIQILSFFDEAINHASLDKHAVAQSGTNAKRFARYHRFIVAVCVVFALTGFAAGVGLVFHGIAQKTAGKVMRKLLFTPLVFAVGGVIFGFAVTVLFAPRDFLAGPVGRKWMQLVGTESILAARIVTLLVTLFCCSFLALFAWAAWSDKYGRPF